MGSNRRRAAFTLIELLVVVAVIALLLSILLPSLKQARAQTRNVLCQNNLRQLAAAWAYYGHEFDDRFPGSTNDVTFFNREERSLCWLGTRLGTGGQDEERVPSGGSVYKYTGREREIYKCPEDRLEKYAQQNTDVRQRVIYSYTAPLLLTGARRDMLVATRWPASFDKKFNPAKDWKTKSSEVSLPWMIVEEDEAWYLNFALDSAWSNWDGLTTRHGGRAAMAHTDGHASLGKYQNLPKVRLDAWKVIYELKDGRRIQAGPYQDRNGGGIRMGYLESRLATGWVK
jgi:prepilin-type N-terminal cleavage/methylation domain-containing protein/prepilin-type processing-associated H-X9-DG protein